MIHTLGLRLIADLSARTPGQNVFVSPLSIGMALGMIAGGAVGATRASILAALGAPDADQEQLDQRFVALAEDLTKLDPEYAEMITYGLMPGPDEKSAAYVDLANGLWLNHTSPFQQAFVDHARQSYQAEVRGADFGDPETVEMINRWVNERTGGNIDKIIAKTDPLTALIIVNAVYFKGVWASPFEARRTVEAPFTLTDGSQIPCDLMHQSGEMGYAETEIFQFLLLPIASTQLGRQKNGAHLAVVLPQPGKSCADALAALGPRWQASVAEARQSISHPTTVNLWLPRFRISYETSLNDTLKALGMGLAFSDQADFGGITPIPTKITDVQHKTTLLVNERGAEAAAATHMSLGHFGTVEMITMRVDRPFVCGIVLNPDLTPLFLGVINRPERTVAA